MLAFTIFFVLWSWMTQSPVVGYPQHLEISGTYLNKRTITGMNVTGSAQPLSFSLVRLNATEGLIQQTATALETPTPALISMSRTPQSTIQEESSQLSLDLPSMTVGSHSQESTPLPHVTPSMSSFSDAHLSVEPFVAGPGSSKTTLEIAVTPGASVITVAYSKGVLTATAVDSVSVSSQATDVRPLVSTIPHARKPTDALQVLSEASRRFPTPSSVTASSLSTSSDAISHAEPTGTSLSQRGLDRRIDTRQLRDASSDPLSLDQPTIKYDSRALSGLDGDQGRMTEGVVSHKGAASATSITIVGILLLVASFLIAIWL